MLTKPDNMDPNQRAHLDRILAPSPHLAATVRHVSAFADMMTKLTGHRLPEWIAEVTADDLPALHSFATGIQRDLAAVTNGLTSHTAPARSKDTSTGNDQTPDVRPRQTRPAPHTNPRPAMITKPAITETVPEPVFRRRRHDSPGRPDQATDVTRYNTDWASASAVNLAIAQRH